MKTPICCVGCKNASNNRCVKEHKCLAYYLLTLFYRREEKMAEKEYIEREAALRVLCDACGNAACPKGLISRCSYYEKMQSIPAADVRPVVFCRDCKHSTPWYSNKSRCFLWHEDGIDAFNDGLCNYGEKREES